MAQKEYPNSPSAGLVNFDQCIARLRPQLVSLPSSRARVSMSGASALRTLPSGWSRLTFLVARTTTPLGVDFLFSARIVD